MGKQTKINLLIIFLFIVIPNQAIFPQSDTIKVALNIGIDKYTSSNLRTGLAASIDGELRKFNDVEIVEKDADLLLKIMVMDNTTLSGIHLGYVISTISLYNFTCSDGYQVYEFWDSSMFIRSDNKLNSLAGDIVAWFNQGSIEILRKHNKEYKK
jgi:hypothetical protein